MIQQVAAAFEADIREHSVDWHMMQPVWLADLDPSRDAGRRGRGMKVGLVCPYSWDVPGGVRSHVADLAMTLGDHGHDVSVLAPVDDPDDAAALGGRRRSADRRPLQRLRRPAELRGQGHPAGARLDPRGRLRHRPRARAGGPEPVDPRALGRARPARRHLALVARPLAHHVGRATTSGRRPWRRCAGASPSARTRAARWSPTSVATRCSSRTASASRPSPRPSGCPTWTPRRPRGPLPRAHGRAAQGAPGAVGGAARACSTRCPTSRS